MKYQESVYDEYEDIEQTFDLEERDKELKTKIWKQVGQNNSNIAQLTYNNSKLFGSLVPEWYYSKVFCTLKLLHRAMLESTLEQPIDLLLRQTLNDDDLVFFLNIKNKVFRKMGVKVFDLDEHKEHPIQKRLVREGYLSKNEIKRRSTPNQHISYVKKQRDSRDIDRDTDQRMKALEQRVLGLEVATTSVVLQQIAMSSAINELQEHMKDIQDRLKDKIKDVRKISLYIMKSSDNNLSYNKVSETFGVSKPTAIKWYKEVENALNDDKEGKS